MVRSLLVRGALVGLLAGALAFFVALLLGETEIGRAIAFDDVRAGAPDGPTLSRTVQSTVGLASGTLLFGLALGGLFALAYALAQGRLGRLGVRGTAGVVALCGFVTIVLVPFAKYPASPPGAENPATIGARTGLYFLLIALSLCAAALAVQLRRALTARLDAWDATVVAALAYLTVIAVAWAVLPPVEEVPADFPATVLWKFRLASLAVQATLWATLGLAFGTLTELSLRRPPGNLADRPAGGDSRDG
jgi:hypothetical protein